MECWCDFQVNYYANVTPFSGYPVNPEWITNLFQGNKISEDVAKQEILKCKKNTKHHLDNVEFVATKRREVWVQQRMEEVDEILKPAWQPMKFYPLVQEFITEHAHIRPRYRFLVITGPSGVGKTQFIRNVAQPRSCLLEVTCVDDVEPDLRAFRPGTHKWILLDEATPVTILRNRKLYQASNAVVTLGQSATQMYSYEVYLHQVRLVVCANDWESRMDDHRINAEGRAWLQQNSIVLNVQEKMWNE